MKKQIILASASPRRQELLKQIVPHFPVVKSRVKESSIRAVTPESFALKAALAKAEAVARTQKNALVIGADTIVVLGKEILGKPKNKKDAVLMLKKLVGRTHRVITAVAVIDSETLKKRTGYETTRVKMKKVPDQTILDYVASGRPLDKAGAYGIQEIEKAFVAKITGDYNNVVGLPLKLTARLLKIN